MKTLRMNRTVTALIGAALIFSSGMNIAMAGAKWSQPSVLIWHSADGSGYAQGTLGGVRNSPDTIGRLYCVVRRSEIVNSSGNVTGQSTLVACSARSASNETVACSTTSDAIANQLNGVSSDSLVEFYFSASGACTRINTYASTSLERKKP